MKVKIIFLTVMTVLSTLTNAFAQVTSTSESGMNSFSFSEYLLISLCTIMLITIWLLARTIKQLTEQMR